MSRSEKGCIRYEYSFGVVEDTNGRSPFESINTDDRITEICDTLSIGASIENMLYNASTTSDAQLKAELNRDYPQYNTALNGRAQ